MKNEENRTYYKNTADEICQAFETDPAVGLTEAESRRRREVYGANELVAAAPISPLGIVLDQFKDFMIGLLLVAIAIAALLGDPVDAVVIIVIVLINAAVGFFQEYRAEKAMAALSKLAAAGAIVLRAGETKKIVSSEVVPGDIVLLEAGDIVPADLRLIESRGLSIDESVLTGESVPVDKITSTLAGADLVPAERINSVFSGTQVTRGRGRGVCVAIGMDTEMGRIAEMVQTRGVKTPLQIRLADFTKVLAFVILAVSFLLFAFGVARGEKPELMLLTALSLMVAAVPEALPAVVGMSLALGAQKMLRRHALVRKLPSVESLGSVTYICTDKTGTLTQNRMTAEEIYCDGRLVPVSEITAANRPGTIEILLRAAVLNNDAGPAKTGEVEEPARGDPTEIALLELAENAGLLKAEANECWPRVDELPFDSERKMMTTVHEKTSDGHVSFTKGAFEYMAPELGGLYENGRRRALEPADLERIQAVCDDMAARGLRTLALASKHWESRPPVDSEPMEKDLDFIGLVGIIDPPREEAKDAVAACRSAGIRLVMITGDHPETARAVAARLGIVEPGSRVVTGSQINGLADNEFAELTRETYVYARVAPEHKLRIVRALQDHGEIVAMTGDGVNDAPALKRADIGVAMGIAGTEVSKQSADLVLLDDNFATIVAAVEGGRKIYDDITKMVRYILSTNLGEVILLFAAPFAGLPLPLLPVHLLWLNLITDGLPSLAFAAGPVERDIMERPPIDPKDRILSAETAWAALRIGGLLAIIALLFQAASFENTPRWQSMLFTLMCVAELGAALALASRKESFFRQKLSDNRWLIAATATTFMLQMAVIYIPFLNPAFKTKPLSVVELGLTLLLSSSLFVAIEIEKWVRRAIERKRENPRTFNKDG